MIETYDCLYLLKMASTPPVYKIGISFNPEGRVRSFRGLPFEVTVAHTIRTNYARELEDTLHRRFKHCHLRYEWFQLTDDELAMVRSVDVCLSIEELPDNLKPTDGRPWSPRTGKGPKPFPYDPAKAISKNGVDRYRFALSRDPQVAAAIGARLRVVRLRVGRSVEEVAWGGYRAMSEGGNWEWLDKSLVQRMEDGTCMITQARVHIFAIHLGMTVRELLGEFAHLADADSVDKPPPGPPHQPPDWVYDRMSTRDRGVSKTRRTASA